jgi:hypothetical protein
VVDIFYMCCRSGVSVRRFKLIQVFNDKDLSSRTLVLTARALRHPRCHQQI